MEDFLRTKYKNKVLPHSVEKVKKKTHVTE